MRLPSYFYGIFTLTFCAYSLVSASYVLPSLLLQMNFDPWRMGVIMSVFYVGATCARPLGGWVVERFGIRRAVTGAALCGAAAALGYLSRNFCMLLLARFLVGVAYSVVYVAILAYQGLVIPEAERGWIFGYLCLGSILPQFVVVPLSEFLIDRGFIRLFMMLSPAFLTVLALYALCMPRAGKGTMGQAAASVAWGSWQELLNRRSTWSLLASIFMVSLTATASVQYIPNLMRGLGFRGTWFTWALTPVSVLVRMTFCGWMLTFFDRRTSFCFWALIEAFSLLLAALSKQIPCFVAAGMIFGLSHGVDYPAISALVPDVFPPRLLPKGSSLFLLANDLPPILLPLLIGALSERMGLAGVLAAIGCFAAGGFPLIYATLWRHPPLRAQTNKEAES